MAISRLVTAELDTLLVRLLIEASNSTNSEDSSGGGNTGSGTMPTPNGGGRHAYEFFAFLLWYLLLVLCCLIPTCCAYRRRRQLEARLNQQQENFDTMQQQNLVFLNNLTQRQNASDALRQEQRCQLVSKAVEETTMIVQEKDIEQWRGVEFRPGSRPSLARSEELDASGKNLGLSHAIEEETTAGLKLPIDLPNSDRTVPAACAICLNAYEIRDRVTWSPLLSCQHAFHQDCIITWLSNKSECPCCRQEFCSLPPAVRQNTSQLTWNRFQPADFPAEVSNMSSASDVMTAAAIASLTSDASFVVRHVTDEEQIEEGVIPSVTAFRSEEATNSTMLLPLASPSLPSVSSENICPLDSRIVEPVLQSCNQETTIANGATEA